MKLYAVVCKETNNVIAKYLHMNGVLKVNDLTIAIVDYKDSYSDPVLIDLVYLSTQLGHINETKSLDIDAFCTLSTESDYDLVYLSRSPDKDIIKCTRQ